MRLEQVRQYLHSQHSNIFLFRIVNSVNLNLLSGEVDPGMVAAAEEQVMKISSAMAHVLGPERATNRLEELRASVEASVSAIAASPSSPARVHPTASQQQKSPHQSPHRRGSRVATTAPPILQLMSNSITASDERRAKILTYIDKAASFLRSKLPVWGQDDRSVAGERLAHEIMLDRAFRLQSPSAESVHPPTAFPLSDCITGQARTIFFLKLKCVNWDLFLYLLAV